MRRLKLVGPLLLAAALCFQTGCFRPYTLPESSGGETVHTLGTIGTSYTTDASDTQADTTGEDTTGSAVTDGSSSDASQGPSALSGTRPSTAASGSGSTATTAEPTNPPSPPAPSEMKGVWVSYIELNTIFENKTESAAKLAIDQIMDNCVSYGLNTVFFHVRANSDAYYKSSLFKPAASVANLIGNGFDPLAYAVASAHSRGLQLHAWVNPYRIGSNLSYRVSGVDYFQKEDKYYYVPTSAGAQKLILDGLRELTLNYAIDGIQYDDYFYPTGMSASAESCEAADYEASGKKLSVADWRRAAVDALISGSYQVAHAKNIVFGVSPDHRTDFNYSSKYADVTKWMSKPGYIDYMCPQLYFGFKHQSSPFDKRVDYWMSLPRASGVQLYVGLAIYKGGIADDTWAGSGRNEWATHNDIMKRSVEYLRAKKVPGMIFYSYTYFDPNNHYPPGSQADTVQKEVENLLPLLR